MHPVFMLSLYSSSDLSQHMRCLIALLRLMEGFLTYLARLVPPLALSCCCVNLRHILLP